MTEIEPESLVAEDGELPAVVAHRGYSAAAPENTLTAVSSAIRVGAQFVEVDVHTTADGVPIVMHDQTVDRTTDGTGDVALLDSSYIATLDAGSWFGSAFAGEPVPRLVDVLDVIAAGSSTLLLEVKAPETDAEVRGMLDAVIAADLADQVIIQSFDPTVLEMAQTYAPQVQRALLRGAVDPDPVAVAQQLGVVAYNPSAAAILARPEAVEDLNQAGIAVMPYTVNDATGWRALTDIGVDAIITDRSGALIGWTEHERMGDRPGRGTPPQLFTAPPRSRGRGDQQGKSPRPSP